MLPDYPKAKRKIWEFYMKVIEAAHRQHLGVFGQIETTIMHEGKTDVISREDGSLAEVVPQRLCSEGLIPADSPGASNIKIEDIVKSLQDVGRGLADEKLKMIIETIDEATREVGNHIGPHHDSVEQIFGMIKRLRFDFDRDGRPLLGNFLVGGPETVSKLREAMERIDSTPELKERMELLIEQKRREFLDREAARKLVD